MWKWKDKKNKPGYLCMRVNVCVCMCDCLYVWVCKWNLIYTDPMGKKSFFIKWFKLNQSNKKNIFIIGMFEVCVTWWNMSKGTSGWERHQQWVHVSERCEWAYSMPTRRLMFALKSGRATTHYNHQHPLYVVVCLHLLKKKLCVFSGCIAFLWRYLPCPSVIVRCVCSGLFNICVCLPVCQCLSVCVSPECKTNDQTPQQQNRTIKQ